MMVRARQLRGRGDADCEYDVLVVGTLFCTGRGNIERCSSFLGMIHSTNTTQQSHAFHLNQNPIRNPSFVQS
jgi:hypothetical protein